MLCSCLIWQNCILNDKIVFYSVCIDFIIKCFKISFINKYHSGIDTKIESKSSGVSGGEKQKIALLRALNKSGRILVLDEPTSNYDQESEEEFIKLISELKYDIIIIVTHSEKIVNIANKVIKLEKRI